MRLSVALALIWITSASSNNKQESSNKIDEKHYYRVTIEKFAITKIGWIPFWIPGVYHTEVRIHNVDKEIVEKERNKFFEAPRRFMKSLNLGNDQWLSWGSLTQLASGRDERKDDETPRPRFFAHPEGCQHDESIEIGWLPKECLTWNPQIIDRANYLESIRIGKDDDILQFKCYENEITCSYYSDCGEVVKEFVEKWSGDYRLLSKNCNCFSQDFVKFLEDNCGLIVKDKDSVRSQVSSLNAVPSSLGKVFFESHFFELLSGVAFWRWVLKAHTWTWFTPVLAAVSLGCFYGCCKLRKFLV